MCKKRQDIELPKIKMPKKRQKKASKKMQTTKHHYGIFRELISSLGTKCNLLIEKNKKFLWEYRNNNTRQSDFDIVITISGL